MGHFLCVEVAKVMTATPPLIGAIGTVPEDFRPLCTAIINLLAVFVL
jgi:hypothetical protein